MAIADFTVLGGGIFGLSIAWVLTQRGAQVRLIEAARIGAGSSGGIVGALAPHTPENWNDKKAFQLDSLLMAKSFWDGVHAAGGVQPGYARTGRLQPIADERALDLARGRERSAKEFWQGKATWQVVARQDVGTWAPYSETGQLIFDTLSARLHPRQACAALVAALKASGVPVLQEGPERGQVIHATGVAGLENLSSRLNRSVGNGVKGQAALLRFDAANSPQLFSDGLHLIPHADGTLAIGSTSARDFEAPSTTDTLLENLITRVRNAMPVLRDAPVIERWAGRRPRSKSRAPMIGPHPVQPGHFIANGGFKIGFGMAPKVAETMADLVLDGRDHIPADFRVEASL